MAKQISIKIMSYNVENLFDSSHDPNKTDWEYLPLASKYHSYIKENCRRIYSQYYRKKCISRDWSHKIVKNKVLNLSKVINSSPVGPDIIFLSEVENHTTLNWLNNTLLFPLKTMILIEGRDRRGIDPAIISRYHLISAYLSNIPFTGIKNIITRQLLISSLKVRSYSVAAISLHLPSQAKPFTYRSQAIQWLNHQAKTLKKTHDLVIAAGDFNLTNTEYRRLRKSIARHWETTYKLGARKGTYYYKKKRQWSYFDMIWLLKNPFCSLDEKSVEILSVGKAFPKRFDGESGSSDHFPVTATISCS